MKKVEVKVNSQKTNPQLNQSQPQNINDLQKIIEDVLTKYLTQQQNLTPQQQKQQNVNDNGKYVVKSGMKASYVALRIEQILQQRKKIELSAIGFAIPVAIDAALLARKDLKGKINIEKIELFEQEVISNGKKKIVSGIRITLSI